MATLQEVAKELNISVSLVSKVLNDRMGTTGCSRQIKQAIIAKARELGFQRNLLAAALRAGKRAAIGVFIHPLGEAGSELVEELLIGISETLNEKDLRIWLTFYQTDEQFLHHCSRTARRDVDGLLVAGVMHRTLAEPIRQIAKSGVPVVTLVSGGMSRNLPNVWSDERQQTYLSTSHLIERGCRRIAHIHNMNARYTGYRQALREHGLKFDPALIYRAANYKLPQGTEAVRYWFGKKLNFDGVVAQSDHQALGVIHELLRRDVKVPEQVRVIGIDDSPLCEASPVLLSSVSQEMRQIGRLASELLLRRIEGETVTSMTVWSKLHVRAST